MQHHQYWSEINTLAEHIREEAAKRDEDVYDVLHETIDGHKWVIYTIFHFDVLRHSDNEDYAIEHLSVESIIKDGRLSTEALAYGAMYGDVLDSLQASG